MFLSENQLCFLSADDIPIQNTEDGTLLASISEEGDTDDKGMNKPIRTPQGSGREKESNKEKDKEGKEKTKFVSTNIPIPNLGKRRDKEKMKNGEKRDSEKKSEKKEKHKHDKDKDKEKENRNGTSSNRNSAAMNSDSDGGGNDVTVITSQQQQSQQQQFEMKVILNKSPRHFETSNTSAEDLALHCSDGEEGKTDDEVHHVGHQIRSPLEANGAQNHIAKFV